MSRAGLLRAIARRDTRTHEASPFIRGYRRCALLGGRRQSARATDRARGRAEIEGWHEDLRHHRRLRRKFFQGEDQLRIRGSAEGSGGLDQHHRRETGCISCARARKAKTGNCKCCADRNEARGEGRAAGVACFRAQSCRRHPGADCCHAGCRSCATQASCAGPDPRRSCRQPLYERYVSLPHVQAARLGSDRGRPQVAARHDRCARH